MYNGKPDNEVSNQLFLKMCLSLQDWRVSVLSMSFESNTQYACMGSNMAEYIGL